MIDFTIYMIETRRDLSKSKGIHSRNSGLNSGLQSFGYDPYDKQHPDKPNTVVWATKQMEALGVIQTHGCRQGVMVFKAGEMPAYVDRRGDSLKAEFDAARAKANKA